MAKFDSCASYTTSQHSTSSSTARRHLHIVDVDDGGAFHLGQEILRWLFLFMLLLYILFLFDCSWTSRIWDLTLLAIFISILFFLFLPFLLLFFILIRCFEQRKDKQMNDPLFSLLFSFVRSVVACGWGCCCRQCLKLFSLCCALRAHAVIYAVESFGRNYLYVHILSVIWMVSRCVKWCKQKYMYNSKCKAKPFERIKEIFVRR